MKILSNLNGLSISYCIATKVYPHFIKLNSGPEQLQLTQSHSTPSCPFGIREFLLPNHFPS